MAEYICGLWDASEFDTLEELEEHVSIFHDWENDWS